VPIESRNWLSRILNAIFNICCPFCSRLNIPIMNWGYFSLFCFILISWGCLTSTTFFFPCNWPITEKVWNYEGYPKQKIIVRYEIPRPLAHSYSWLMVGLWAKHMGLKRGAMENTLGEHTGNMMRTHWELEGNMLGTKEKWKESHPPTTVTEVGWKVRLATYTGHNCLPICFQDFTWTLLLSPYSLPAVCFRNLVI